MGQESTAITTSRHMGVHVSGYNLLKISSWLGLNDAKRNLNYFMNLVIVNSVPIESKPNRKKLSTEPMFPIKRTRVN